MNERELHPLAEEFRRVLGVPVERETIKEILGAEGDEAVRLAVRSGDSREPRRLLRVWAARRLARALPLIPVSDAVASRVLHTVGYSSLLAALEESPRATERLARWAKEAVLELSERQAPAAMTDAVQMPLLRGLSASGAAPVDSPASAPGPRPARRTPDPPPGAYVPHSCPAMLPDAATRDGEAQANTSVRALTVAPMATQIQRDYDQLTVYGRDVGLGIERSPMKSKITRGVDRPRTLDGPTTINFRMAKARGTRALDGLMWDGAIQVMLMPQEIQLCLGVLLGLVPKYRAVGHGELHDKWFELEENNSPAYAGAVRVTVSQGKDDKRDMRRVNISANDIGRVLGIFFRAAHTQLRIDGQELLATIRRSCDLWTKSADGRKVLDRQVPGSDA
jgi:hypothetical protein